MSTQHHGGLDRQACTSGSCGYVHWDNPVPVVAAIVEHEGDIILARNVAWPGNFFALITGYLEKNDPSPEIGARREVKEELNLDAQEVTFVGHYPFARQNQLIIAYHVVATGETHSIRELLDVAFRRIGIDDWAPLVKQDPRFMRPAEVELLIGDPTKAREVLGWTPTVSFEQLVTMMVDNDLEEQRALGDR